MALQVADTDSLEVKERHDRKTWVVLWQASANMYLRTVHRGRVEALECKSIWESFKSFLSRITRG
jgi:hypothetical protein